MKPFRDFTERHGSLDYVAQLQADHDLHKAAIAAAAARMDAACESFRKAVRS